MRSITLNIPRMGNAGLARGQRLAIEIGHEGRYVMQAAGLFAKIVARRPRVRLRAQFGHGRIQLLADTGKCRIGDFPHDCLL